MHPRQQQTNEIQNFLLKNHISIPEAARLTGKDIGWCRQAIMNGYSMADKKKTEWFNSLKYAYAQGVAQRRSHDASKQPLSQ